MKRTLAILLLFILVAVAARWSCYTVDAAEYAYVTVLGRHVATHDGGASGEDGAGLYIGWPWPVQMVQRLDRRLQQFDLPALEQLTHDPQGNTIDKRLLIEAYVCWRVADRDAVDLFIRRIGSSDRARAILAPRINSQLGAAIGQMKMDDLVNTTMVDPRGGRTRVDETVETLRSRLLSTLREPIRREYGIDLVDIRLRRFNHPASVRDSIFQRIRSERSKKVTEYQSEGERLARNIESDAEEKVQTTLAKARSEVELLKGKADIEAMQIRNQAHSQDPEFYAFLKQMEKLQSILGENKTVLLLSTHRPLFEMLFKPPRPEAAAKEEKKESKR
jgi:modulator of FtsH protease HflC